MAVIGLSAGQGANGTLTLSIEGGKFLKLVQVANTGSGTYVVQNFSDFSISFESINGDSYVGLNFQADPLSSGTIHGAAPNRDARMYFDPQTDADSPGPEGNWPYDTENGPRDHPNQPHTFDYDWLGISRSPQGMNTVLFPPADEVASLFRQEYGRDPDPTNYLDMQRAMGLWLANKHPNEYVGGFWTGSAGTNGAGQAVYELVCIG
jgi:hypothetical protein